MMVRMRHVRAARICASGARDFFRANGLDWHDFVKNGISTVTLEEIGNPVALRAVAAAQAETVDG